MGNGCGVLIVEQQPVCSGGRNGPQDCTAVRPSPCQLVEYGKWDEVIVGFSVAAAVFGNGASRGVTAEHSFVLVPIETTLVRHGLVLVELASSPASPRLRPAFCYGMGPWSRSSNESEAISEPKVTARPGASVCPATQPSEPARTYV